MNNFPTSIFPVFGIKRKECFVVDVTGEDYQACVAASSHYWANTKKGTYGEGLIATSEDKYKPVRTGLLGEMAFSKTFDVPIDLAYREGGDSYDNMIGKWKFDIKCAQRNRGVGLIYHTSKGGTRIPADKDVYVFGYVEEETSDAARIVLVGYCLKMDLPKFRVRPGKAKGAHMNYEIPYWQTRDIRTLWNLKTKFYPSK
jgi:hypothetical protein